MDNSTGGETSAFEQQVRVMIGPLGTSGFPTELAPIMRRMIDAVQPPLPWRNVVEALTRLGFSTETVARLKPSYDRSLRYRPRTHDLRGSEEPDILGRDGRSRFLPAEATWGDSALEDVEGHDQKPDPLKGDRPRTYYELDDRLLEYWTWAGQPSSRVLAERSGHIFSHTTVAKLTGRRTGTKPFSARQKYVVAFINACGGGEGDQRRWVSAWRWIACPPRGQGPRDERSDP